MWLLVVEKWKLIRKIMTKEHEKVSFNLFVNIQMSKLCLLRNFRIFIPSRWLNLDKFYFYFSVYEFHTWKVHQNIDFLCVTRSGISMKNFPSLLKQFKREKLLCSVHCSPGAEKIDKMFLWKKKFQRLKNWHYKKNSSQFLVWQFHNWKRNKTTQENEFFRFFYQIRRRFKFHKIVTSQQRVKWAKKNYDDRSTSYSKTSKVSTQHFKTATLGEKVKLFFLELFFDLGNEIKKIFLSVAAVFQFISTFFRSTLVFCSIKLRNSMWNVVKISILVHDVMKMSKHNFIRTKKKWEFDIFIVELKNHIHITKMMEKYQEATNSLVLSLFQVTLGEFLCEKKSQESLKEFFFISLR